MQTPLTVKSWRREEYDRLIELGVFQGEAVELIGGELIVAEPQGVYHASALSRVDYALRAIVPAGFFVRVQAPVSLGDDSEPEPDLAVVAGRPGDYGDGHPTLPVLAVEVADSSLAFDRARKGSLYARAQIQDYWIVNLAERVLEVYREPAMDAGAAFGWRYRSATHLAPPATVTPLAFASRSLAVADLFP
jgi:Uma2 family endonuclease